MPDLTLEKLHLFLLVVMPGVIAIKVYDQFHPPEKRDFGSSLLEAVAYGLINTAIWSWCILDYCNKDFATQHPGLFGLINLGFLVISPALLAYATYKIRRFEWMCRWLGFPDRTAWDDFFKRRDECWILFSLKNGKMIGGYYSTKSYAATYPQQPEVYVEEVWRVNERGQFVEKVEGTGGMIVRYSDCELIEFFPVDQEATYVVQPKSP